MLVAVPERIIVFPVGTESAVLNVLIKAVSPLLVLLIALPVWCKRLKISLAGLFKMGTKTTWVA